MIDNAYQVMSILYIALAQATDCLGLADKLSLKTREQYDAIRAICPKFIEDTSFYEEIAETSELIEELTGKGTEYVRPPFGTWNEGLESNLDLIPVMWTIDTLDWTTQNVDAIVNHVMKNAGENDIILMHDSYKSTVQATERIIKLLKAEGFEFVTVDEVLF